MRYILTNGTHYLQIDENNVKTITKDKNNAYLFRNKGKASNALKNIDKMFRRHNLVVAPAEEDMIKNSVINFKSNYNKEEAITTNILDEIKDLQGISKKLKNRYMYLLSRLSEEDKAIVDIEHAMEFYICNASKGYKLYKLMHDHLIIRRQIKDEIETIKIITSSMSYDTINTIDSEIDKIYDRSYKPRILNELFAS